MSEEHFFNSESDNLIDLIDGILKTKISAFEDSERRENTTDYLMKCLNDIQ
jgi:hypothetical protein